MKKSRVSLFSTPISPVYLFADLNRTDAERAGSPVERVDDPDEADLFYVPMFSSLSLIVNTNRPGAPDSGFSDEKMQDELVQWLEQQEYWRRNNGRDHVIVAGDPNALYRVIDWVKNSVLLLSDFGRVRSDQGSLVKDLIVPYAHQINSYMGEIGVEKRRLCSSSWAMSPVKPATFINLWAISPHFKN